MAHTQTPLQQEPAQIVGKAYDLALWILSKTEKFPRSYRLSVGDRLVSNALDLLLNVVEAAYALEKGDLLTKASSKANALRYLLRLSKDLRLVSVDSYAHATERVDEIGRMIGGWQRSTSRKK